MRIIADLHIHSKYSRACSRELTPQNIDQWCQYKGIDIVGTADFTHPTWFKELKENLEEKEPGLYQLKNSNSPVRFMATTEISCIYKQNEKARRLHICIFVPDLETVEKINNNFAKRGFNIKSDGRPIIGMSAKDLTQVVLDINPKSLIIPAHAWTPWFAVFGSKSGFDSIQECFEELAPHIHAIETGLSSDPPMNWQLSTLDDITLISNSDAHSPANLGREANVFDIEKNKLSYAEIVRIIKEKDKEKFLYTIEFFPEEGKYHFDGHAACQFSAHPTESKKYQNLCPKCKKPLTLGVMHRINDLADRKKIESKNHIPYKNLIPLQEIIAEVFTVGKKSKKVQAEYFNIIKNYPEFQVLIDLTEEELNKITSPEITEAIIKVRNKETNIIPGYDGIFGKINILNDKHKPVQNQLF